MSTYVVKLPDVGEGVAEAEIVAWHVAVGDTIDDDAPLVEVMTDKATVELPSPVAGVITRLGGEIGDVLPVGSELVAIELDGDAAQPGGNGRVHDHADDEAPVAVTANPAEPPAPQTTDEPALAGLAIGEPSPVPQRNGAKALAAPAVRARAAALGIDLNSVTGTGPEGRVLHGDLDSQLTRRAAPTAPVANTSDDHDDDAVEVVKLVGLRRNIAQRMHESYKRIPHFTYVEEVDVTELESLRGALNAAHPDRPRLTLLPFIMRAVIITVGEQPALNARFDEERGATERHSAVHLGIATQTPRGLMVPVVHHAQRLDLWTSSAEVARLAGAARDSSISLQELTGSTITITSLGALGGIVTTPIINSPEVAIIGVNKIATRPELVHGMWTPRQVMNLSSSFDHRVVDGWDAAQFVQRIRAVLEHPALLSVRA